MSSHGLDRGAGQSPIERVALRLLVRGVPSASEFRVSLERVGVGLSERRRTNQPPHNTGPRVQAGLSAEAANFARSGLEEFFPTA